MKKRGEPGALYFELSTHQKAGTSHRGNQKVKFQRRFDRLNSTLSLCSLCVRSIKKRTTKKPKQKKVMRKVVEMVNKHVRWRLEKGKIDLISIFVNFCSVV